MLKKSLLTIAIVSVLSTGCGSSDDKKVASTTIGGGAAKGIIKKADVVAHTLNSDGTKNVQVGSGTTDDNGLYALTLNDSYDGTSPLLLELMANDDTTMVCDAPAGCGVVARGGDISLAGTGFTLTSVVPGASKGSSLNGTITPFTDMATKKALTGEISNASILAANSQVSQLVGVNILETSPVDIADSTTLSAASPNAQRYSIMLAALASQAFVDADTSGAVEIADVIANLEAFNTDFATDGNVGSEGGLSVAALYAAALAETDTVAESLSSDTAEQASQFATVMAERVDATGGVLTPTATTGENPTEVAQAKALMSEVRTWASALSDLETPANLFLEEAEIINNTLNTNSEAVLEVYALAVETAANAIADALENGTDTPTSATVKNSSGGTVGTISITDNTEAGSAEYVVTATDIAGVAIDTTVGLNVDPDTDSVAAGDVILAVTGTASNDEVKVSLSDATFTIGVAEAANLDSDENIVMSGMSITGMLTAETLVAGETSFETNGEKIVASVEIKYVALNAAAGRSLVDENNLSLEKIALNNLTVSNSSGETAGLSASLTMNNAASIDAIAYLNLSPEIYLDLEGYVSPSDFNIDAAKDDFGIETFTSFNYGPQYIFTGGAYTPVVQTCAAGTDVSGASVGYSCIDGDLTGIEAQVEALFPQSYVTNVELLNVYLSGNYAGGGVRLEVDTMETAENFIDATLNITGNIDLEGQDAATLTVTADKTGAEVGEIMATLAYSGKSLTMKAMIDGDEDDTSLNFTNVDGAAMMLVGSSDDISGNVTVNDNEVGTIEESDRGIMTIYYNDGTFESL